MINLGLLLSLFIALVLLLRVLVLVVTDPVTLQLPQLPLRPVFLPLVGVLSHSISDRSTGWFEVLLRTRNRGRILVGEEGRNTML